MLEKTINDLTNCQYFCNIGKLKSEHETFFEEASQREELNEIIKNNQRCIMEADAEISNLRTKIQGSSQKPNIHTSTQTEDKKIKLFVKNHRN